MPKQPENKKCPNCGACQECGHGGTQYVPYPVQPWPVNPYRPWPYTQPWRYGTGTPNWSVTSPNINASSGGQISAGGFTNYQ